MEERAEWAKTDQPADDVRSYVLHCPHRFPDGHFVSDVLSSNHGDATRKKSSLRPRHFLDRPAFHPVFRVLVEAVEGEIIRNNGTYGFYDLVGLLQRSVYHDRLDTTTDVGCLMVQTRCSIHLGDKP